MSPIKSITFFIAFAAIITTGGCTKDTEGPCATSQNFHISSNSPVQIGQELRFAVPTNNNSGTYYWTGPGYTNQYNEGSFTNAVLKNRGWYYATVMQDGCETITDSAFFDVQLNQGTPVCNAVVNTCIYSNLGDDVFSSVQKSLDSRYGSVTLAAGGAVDMDVVFHPAWNDREPADGIYITNDTQVFDPYDDSYNKVFILTIKESILFQCQPGQQVFVSHVNGKLRVQFCDLTLSGYNGNSYLSQASGNITEL